MMSESNNSRRDFLKTTGAVAAATGVLSAVKPVHAAAEGTIQVALVGWVVEEQEQQRML